MDDDYDDPEQDQWRSIRLTEAFEEYDLRTLAGLTADERASQARLRRRPPGVVLQDGPVERCDLVDLGEVEVALTADVNGVVLCVRDSGIGIPDEEQEHLFERFYRASAATTRAISGAGLGLTIAKAIVEGHGGQIAVSSRAGAGTSMRATLPARPVASSRSAATA